MKEGIHPNYQRTTIRCACGEVIETASTKKDITVEICSKCHPFYTGKQKLVDTSGRVDKFNKKYGLWQFLGKRRDAPPGSVPSFSYTGGKTMASRILHLAAAKLILDEHPTADEKRFRLGSILPDAGERVSAHFRVRIDGGTKTMMAPRRLPRTLRGQNGRSALSRVLSPSCAGHRVPQGILSRPRLEGGLAAEGRAALRRLPHSEYLGH